MFSLYYTAQVIIWVIVGGLGTLIGPVLGAVTVQYLTTLLGTFGALHPALARRDPSLVLGAVLVLFVVLVPRGLWPALASLARRLAGEGRR
jgi:branched-chain amino acid transport system permease protein